MVRTLPLPVVPEKGTKVAAVVAVPAGATSKLNLFLLLLDLTLNVMRGAVGAVGLSTVSLLLLPLLLALPLQFLPLPLPLLGLLPLALLLHLWLLLLLVLLVLVLVLLALQLLLLLFQLPLAVVVEILAMVWLVQARNILRAWVGGLGVGAP